MKLATGEQGKKYLEEGRNFAENTKAPFNDVKRVATVAIAEYLANKDGFTIYKCAETEK